MLHLVVLEGTEFVATHASALKAHKQSLKNREHNRQFRSRLRGALRAIRASIDDNDLAGAKSALKQTISLIDKDPLKFERLPPGFEGQTLVGWAFDREVLEQAGIRDAGADRDHRQQRR